MKSLTPWLSRPAEEANHFNPAFCGALIYEFCRSYEKACKRQTALVLPFCALPVTLHSETRILLPNSTITSLFAWLEKTPKVKVGFAERSRALVPYVREGLLFSIKLSALTVNSSGEIALGSKRASFGNKFLDMTTSEMREIVEATRLVGRWFAAAGDEATILAGWGVKP